jgi:hypothetical protein
MGQVQHLFTLELKYHISRISKCRSSPINFLFSLEAGYFKNDYYQLEYFVSRRVSSYLSAYMKPNVNVDSWIPVTLSNASWLKGDGNHQLHSMILIGYKLGGSW